MELPNLRRVLYDPLLPYLTSTTRLIIAADGHLAHIPWEILPCESEGYLIDKYAISYVGCGRELIHAEEFHGPILSKPVVMACPDFEVSCASKRVESDPCELARALDLHSIRFEPLPATRKEGEQVANILGVTPLLGAEVLEGTLKSVKSPWVLHVATHGFFLDHLSYTSTSSTGQTDGFVSPADADFADPLLRSGLALSGAQTWLDGGALPPNAEDGILTAADVMTLDLNGTELVVLSACSTGVGEVRSGEGVYGLRRAFLAAGARTLVMSLWSVSDESTSQLMSMFYANLITGQLPRHEALRSAQLSIRDYTDESGQQPYQHPYYWGPFICQGETAAIKENFL